VPLLLLAARRARIQFYSQHPSFFCRHFLRTQSVCIYQLYTTLTAGSSYVRLNYIVTYWREVRGKLMSSNSSVSQSQRPVGPPMKAREGLEFLVRVGALELETLSKSKHPSNVADLNHLEGLCYELCRFIQAARSAYERLLNSARRDPEYLENCIV